MAKILFICHGNICRSPMAEFVMKDMVRKAGLESQFHIESTTTSTEEIGNPVYPPALRELMKHGIDCASHALQSEGYEKYDPLIGMDRANIRSMYRICGGESAKKMHLLLDFTDRPGNVADPWYTGDFATCLAGCDGSHLKKGHLAYQLGERCVRIAEVEGSIPFESTNKNRRVSTRRFLLGCAPVGRSTPRGSKCSGGQSSPCANSPLTLRIYGA